jgi:hypothetical protein
VRSVEQRSDENGQYHQNNVSLHDERGHKIGYLAEWIVSEHHYLLTWYSDRAYAPARAHDGVLAHAIHLALLPRAQLY